MSDSDNSARDDTRRDTPALIPQPHGGALLSGGVLGHRGGPGRPPSALREVMRLSLEERLPILEKLADDPTVAPRDRLKAIEILARYGIGTQLEHSGQVEHKTTRTLSPSEIRDELRAALDRMDALNEPNPLPPSPAKRLETVDADFEIVEEDGQ